MCEIKRYAISQTKAPVSSWHFLQMKLTTNFLYEEIKLLVSAGEMGIKHFGVRRIWLG